MQQDENAKRLSANLELSAIWQELLGGFPFDTKSHITPSEVQIPVLESDPWSALVKAKGVEAVDLQQLRLRMSDQDVEQLLQIMQEQPAPNSKKSEEE